MITLQHSLFWGLFSVIAFALSLSSVASALGLSSVIVSVLGFFFSNCVSALGLSYITALICIYIIWHLPCIW